MGKSYDITTALTKLHSEKATHFLLIAAQLVPSLHLTQAGNHPFNALF